jgi:DNA-binding response OmpR family regulator
MDWTLPDFSGVELCRRLRASNNTTPVLMLTARDDVDERVKALDAGVDDYLTKPFNLKELHARVRARLRRGGYEQEPTGREQAAATRRPRAQSNATDGAARWCGSSPIATGVRITPTPDLECR